VIPNLSSMSYTISMMSIDSEPSSSQYTYRPGPFSRERSFWLEPQALGFSRGGEEARISYSEVDEVRLYRSFMRGAAAIDKKIMWRMHLHCRSGARLVLSPLHYNPPHSWEDRTRAYASFTNELLGHLWTADPNLRIIAEHHWAMRLRRQARRKLGAVAGAILLQLFHIIRRCEPDSAANFVARFMRAVGPWLRGHRVAHRNLLAAFPDKSEQEIESILQGMWDNLGRVIAEYAFLDRLWDFDLNQAFGRRIVVDPPVLDCAAHVRGIGKPVLCFGAHLANWEMAAVALAALGLDLAVVYRPPDFAPIAKEILELREQLMCRLIAAGPGAAMRLKAALDDGLSVGMLVDQHFTGGIDVIFLGRRCKVNPTLGRLARLTNYAIHGVRTMRLPGGRLRVELTDALAIPRDEDGKIDVAGTMQMITSVIESWVREHPEQWLWMHRRWR
jgi:Kdo2-lipid IVA lauroyltransferase/acyltransferase